MSILDRALDRIKSTEHYDSPHYSLYTYEVIRIVQDVAGEYEVELAKEKARVDVYKEVIKNLRLNIIATSREEEE